MSDKLHEPAEMRPSETVALIPARAGSVRLPGKNRARVGRFDLVGRSLRHAAALGCSRAIVSTDDPLIGPRRIDGLLVERLERPDHLSTASASSSDVIAHVVDAASLPDTAMLVLLQPTSPFRNRATLDAAVRLVTEDPGTLAQTVHQVGRQHEWYRTIQDGVLRPAADTPPLFEPTGGVYAFMVSAFRQHLRLSSFTARSIVVGPVEACDIDEFLDLEFARAIVRAGLGDDIIEGKRQHA